MTKIKTKSAKYGALGVAAILSTAVATASFAEVEPDSRQSHKTPAQGSHAQQRMDMMNPYSEAMLDRVAQQLQLDEPTKAKASKLFADARQERKEVIEGLRSLREPIQNLEPSSGDYVDQVAELAEKRGDLMMRLDVQQAETRHAFYAMLTDEQISKLEALPQRS